MSNFDISLSHNIQHERFALISPVGSNSQVDFIGISVSFVGDGYAQNWINRGLLDMLQNIVILSGKVLRKLLS